MSQEKVEPWNDVTGKNYLKCVEDAIEQNDNNFDGIINNLPIQKETDIPKKNSDKDRESVLDKLKKQSEKKERKPPAFPKKQVERDTEEWLRDRGW